MTLAERQEKLIDDINALGDCFDQYSYLIACSGELPKMSFVDHCDKYIIKGCQSKVWIKAEVKEGKLKIEMDSDTLIIRGVLAILFNLLEGCSAAEVAVTDLSFLDRTEIAATFTSDRNAGIRSVIKYLQEIARASL